MDARTWLRDVHLWEGPEEREQEKRLLRACAMPGFHRRARIHYAGIGHR